MRTIISILGHSVRTGAMVNEVIRAIGTDTRIGKQFLNAFTGFGGSSFQKDILNLVYICEQFGLDEVAQFKTKVTDMNECQKRTFIIYAWFNTVSRRKIAVFLALEKNTCDVREAPALGITVNRADPSDARIYVHWVLRRRTHSTKLWSSEIKVVDNAMVAQRVSSIISTSGLCARAGAVASAVSSATGTGTRIGKKLLNALTGFDGSCFQEGIMNLAYICEQFGPGEVALYWRKSPA